MTSRSERLNLLDFTAYLQYPERLAPSAWLSHVPFAMFLVEALRPDVLVELGTHAGVSYCAFCQAVNHLGANTRCFAVDTWEGDPQTGPYGPEVLEDLKSHHDPRYGHFSSLIPETFDEAVSRFEDESIDLLHIDGFHSYESVKHDLETWLPKMSQRSVMLLHDINVSKEGYGVWRLWEEAKTTYPAFQFEHGYGLGLLAVGKVVPPPIIRLIDGSDSDQTRLRELFAQLGQRLEASYWRGVELESASKTMLEQQELLDDQVDLLNARSRDLEHALEESHAKGDEITRITGRNEDLRSSLAGLERAHSARAIELRNALEDSYKKSKRLASLAGRIDDLMSSVVDLKAANRRRTGELVDALHLNEDLGRRLETKSHEADALYTELTYVYSLRSWHLVTRWWSIRDGIRQYPSRTLRRVRELLATSYKMVREEGLRAFASRLSKWLRGERRNLPKPDMGLAGPTGSMLPNIQGRYEVWIHGNEPSPADLDQQKLTVDEFAFQPLISVIMPVFNPPADVLRAALDSVLDQTYDKLELCISDASDHEDCIQILEQYAQKDHRVRVQRLGENRGISENSNAAMDAARGEFVALMDHDDTLAPFALFSVVEALNDDPEADILYSDEDKLDADGQRVFPFLKPDWSPELLHSSMYVGHLTVYRTSLVQEMGGFRREFDGSQDYDLILRASEVVNRVCHIPKVLYHWRMTPASAAAGAKPMARQSNIGALADALHRRGIPGKVAAHNWSSEIVFDPPATPLISIIVPSDELENIRLCATKLASLTTYENYELIVVTNSRVVRALGEKSDWPFLRLVAYDGTFNFSKKCNLGARAAQGEYFVFLNDDVTPLTAEWLEGMLGYALQPDIGGVSPKLLYANDTIQFAGMVTAVRDIVGTSFHRWNRDADQYNSLALSYRDVSVLTGACLMISRETFSRVGGWDELNTPVANSDLDLSFKIRELGLRLVYTPFVELRHLGHKSIGQIETKHQDDTSHLHMLDRWGKYVSYDPYFPPGMRELTYHEYDKYRILAPTSDHSGDRDWDSQKNVLLISHDLSLSGAPLILFEIARYLENTGYFVTVVAPEEGGMQENYEGAGIPLIIDPLILANPEVQRHFWAPFHFIIANTVLGWRCIRLAKKLGVPCAWLVQESEFGLEHLENIGPEATETFDLADEVIVPASMTAEIYQHLRPHGTIRHKHYGINDPETEVAPTLPFERSQDKLHVVLSGTLEHRKGADVLIDALHLLPVTSRSGFDVYLVGRHMFPDYLARIRETAADLPNVHLLGEVPRSEGLAYMKQSDVLVCASRQETGPLVVMEAMALGKAVISTKVGAASEIIRDGVNGFLIDIDDSRALAEILAELATDPEQVRRIGQTARLTYEAELTIGRYGKEMEAIFRAHIDNEKTIEPGWKPVADPEPRTQ